MGRPATGSVVEERHQKDTTFVLRFVANGGRQYQRAGYRSEGMNRVTAQKMLKDVLAEVHCGIWKPRAVELEEPRECPSFHVFASEWHARAVAEGGRRGEGLTKRGREDLEWRLSKHLVRAFGARRLDGITVEDVDRFRGQKKAQGLGASSVNKLLACLAAILEQAVEYGYIQRNPAGGKRRRLPTTKPERPYLDRADHIAALLDGAGKVDDEALLRKGQRRALVAVFVYAGLRRSELLALRWRDIDLGRGTIIVREGKTDAAARTVYILPVLRDELDSYRVRQEVDPDALIFASRTGRALTVKTVRGILAKAVEHANDQLASKGIEPLPHLTPHGLRRTYASLLFALGETPVYAMNQLGHADSTVTLNFYAKVMDRRDGEAERLRALVEGEFRQDLGRESEIRVPEPVIATPQTPVESGI